MGLDLSHQLLHLPQPFRRVFRRERGLRELLHDDPRAGWLPRADPFDGGGDRAGRQRRQLGEPVEALAGRLDASSRSTRPTGRPDRPQTQTVPSETLPRRVVEPVDGLGQPLQLVPRPPGEAVSTVTPSAIARIARSRAARAVGALRPVPRQSRGRGSGSVKSAGARLTSFGSEGPRPLDQVIQERPVGRVFRGQLDAVDGALAALELERLPPVVDGLPVRLADRPRPGWSASRRSPGRGSGSGRPPRGRAPRGP